MTRRLRQAAFALSALVLLTGAAADPADRLPNPAQEARARAIFHEVRCLVCQSESIDESDAALAHDLRQLVRQQVAAGKSDDQIRAYLVSRYGQFVLLSPKASLGNAILWVGPLGVVAAGAVLLFTRRRKRDNEPESLTAEEEMALDKLSSEKSA
ncbi:MAG TPA: cytochrome c-type biogenesis protein [Caulobacteraceae bacterium]|jgi:cytochrome c-type biogenesis protein CcmH|nr:cytochrome c-type biogenesis protein [Caulobacteraceae bacterium]